MNRNEADRNEQLRLKFNETESNAHLFEKTWEEYFMCDSKIENGEVEMKEMELKRKQNEFGLLDDFNAYQQL